MAPLVRVDEPGEIVALLRALFAAKFHAPEDGPELAGARSWPGCANGQ